MARLPDEETFGCIVTVIVLGIIVVFGLFFAPMQCSAKWQGRSTSWGPIKGCQVLVKGQWWPEDRVRAIDD